MYEKQQGHCNHFSEPERAIIGAATVRERLRPPPAPSRSPLRCDQRAGLTKNVIKHCWREPPRKRVLLAGMIRAEQRKGADVCDDAVPEARPRTRQRTERRQHAQQAIPRETTETYGAPQRSQ